MIWIQKGGRRAPQAAVEAALLAEKEFRVPAGILLGTCECETNFRLGMVSDAGAVGPMQFLPRYEEDYHRYAGFAFDLKGWDAIRGAAAVFRTYAAWAEDRHGLEGEDGWRFAVSAHRYGQNSETCLDLHNKRVTDVEKHMRRNGLWYETAAEEPAESLAEAAAKWALQKIGCRYSRSERLEKDCFDCSSLAARAYMAQGLRFGCKGAPVPNSSQMVYDDQFRLLWPAGYDDIGKDFGGENVLALADAPGDLQFLCTDMTTARKNRITHVAMAANGDSIVHARGRSYGVRSDERKLYAGRVCALLRYDPISPLRKGMQGSRVRQLQEKLRAKGADIRVDGIFGSETEKAVFSHDRDGEEAETARFVRVTENSVHLRAGPGTEYSSIGTVRKNQLLKLADREDWQIVLADGVLGYVAKQYLEEA